MTEIKSKHGTVAMQPYQMYMSMVDLRNFCAMLPEDKRSMVQADYDTLTATVQGFNIGVKVHNRVPYSMIELVDYGAPLAFHIELHFDPAKEDPYKTDFWIKADADLNFMMKMMLGNKLQEAFDKIVDSMVDASNGKMPEGFDPNSWPKNPFQS